MKFKKIVVFAVLLSLLTVQCATNYVTGERQFMLISEHEEITLGNNYAPEVTYEFGGKYNDNELDAYVNEVGNSLVENCHRRNLDYTFSVANSSIINAFALPGGHIYITRGMLDELHNEAEMAAVLGHEIAHVTARHSAQLKILAPRTSDRVACVQHRVNKNGPDRVRLQLVHTPEPTRIGVIH